MQRRMKYPEDGDADRAGLSHKKSNAAMHEVYGAGRGEVEYQMSCSPIHDTFTGRIS